MSVDLRRFTYALEPLRRQRKWQLEALLTRLGRIQVAVQQAEDELSNMRGQLQAASQRIALATARRMDPSSHVLGLQWLIRQKSRILDQEQRLESLRSERTEIRARCQAHHHKVEVLDEHRAECVFEFTREEAGRQSLEADRDWIARARLAHHRHSHRGKIGQMVTNLNASEGRTA